jgi:hypothetical protein
MTMTMLFFGFPQTDAERETAQNQTVQTLRFQQLPSIVNDHQRKIENRNQRNFTSSSLNIFSLQPTSLENISCDRSLLFNLLKLYVYAATETSPIMSDTQTTPEGKEASLLPHVPDLQPIYQHRRYRRTLGYLDARCYSMAYPGIQLA